MKVFKRGEFLYFTDMDARDPIRKVLRHLKYHSPMRMWRTEATNSAFIDLYTYNKSILQFQDKETGEWINKCRNVIHRLSELQKGLSEDSRDVVLPDAIDYIWQPFKHQKEAIAFALNLPKCALWLDMGLGKTYTSITIAKLRHAVAKLGAIERVLIVSPRSLIYQWDNEIATLAPYAQRIVVKGKPDQKVRAINSIKPGCLSFTLVTYEGLYGLKDELDAACFDMYILDEATKMKNPKAQRTKSTAELCQGIKYGVSLTGMAYVNNPLDLFSQYLAIDTTVFGDNQWDFSQRYIDYGNASFGRFIKGYKNMNELKSRAYFTAFSRTKNQCLDLPERVYQTRTLPLYEAQYAWYDNLLEQINNKLAIPDEETDQPVTVQQVVTMLEKFQQITAGFLTLDSGEQIWLDSPKYEELVSILRESDDKFIVWARHSYAIKKLNEVLIARGFKPVVLDRTSSDDFRKTTKFRFKRGDIKVLILQIQSECRGNDFTCETSPVSAVFFENTASIEERAQAEDRCHRIGMTGTAVYIDLVCEDTYDEGIQLLLKSKRRISEYIREQSLNILLGKGGSIAVQRTKSKKRPKLPDQVAEEEALKAEERKDWLSEIPGMETF